MNMAHSSTVSISLLPAFAALGAVLALGTSGCATVLHGTTQKVSITSEPPGARGLVEPAGIKITTPAEVELQRKQNYTVHFELDGYKSQNAYLCRTPSSATHGNILLGGIVGVATDLNNGAAFELTPAPLAVTLERDPGAPAPPSP